MIVPPLTKQRMDFLEEDAHDCKGVVRQATAELRACKEALADQQLYHSRLVGMGLGVFIIVFMAILCATAVKILSLD